MRVLHVTATYPPSINGVAVAVSNLKSQMQAEGCEVTVLAPANARPFKPDKQVLRYAAFSNPILSDYPLPLFPNLANIYAQLRLARPDIVHVHHPFYIGLAARLIAKKFNVPLVFTYHTNYGAYAKHYLKLIPSQLKAQLIQKSVDSFCSNADLVVSPSAAIASILQSRIPNLNVVTIPSGLPPIPAATDTPAQVRQRLGVAPGTKLLLAVSRLSPEKNVSLLIYMMCELSTEFMMMIIGSGEQAESLNDLAVKLGVASRVIFVGRVDHDDLGAYYQAANLLVCSSTTETQGLIFLEALSFGLPIVAVESGAARDWVQPDLGVLTGSDQKSLANGVKQMLKRDVQAISKQAKQFSAKFTLEKMTQLLLEEYKKLSAGREVKSVDK